MSDIDSTFVTEPVDWACVELPLPPRCAYSEGKWIVDGTCYLEGLGKRGAYGALFRWGDGDKKPAPALDLKPNQYAAHYACEGGFCGALLKGETQEIPVAWVGGEVLEHDRGGFKRAQVLHRADNRSVGCISVPDENGWDGNSRAVQWERDGTIVWLGPEGRTSLAVQTNGDMQVGHISERVGDYRACKWHGSEDTLECLHPEGAIDSGAEGLDGDLIFGFIAVSGWGEAAIAQVPVFWPPGSSDPVRLLPADGVLLGGEICASRHGLGAGSVWSEVNDNDHGVNRRATLWHLDSRSSLDLHSFVGPRFTQSVARSISVSDRNMAILGCAWVFDEHGIKLEQRAVLWSREIG